MDGGGGGGGKRGWLEDSDGRLLFGALNGAELLLRTGDAASEAEGEGLLLRGAALVGERFPRRFVVDGGAAVGQRYSFDAYSAEDASAWVRAIDGAVRDAAAAATAARRQQSGARRRIAALSVPGAFGCCELCEARTRATLEKWSETCAGAFARDSNDSLTLYRYSAAAASSGHEDEDAIHGAVDALLDAGFFASVY